MSSVTHTCTCVIDTHGLAELVNASSNLKGVLLDKLKSGAIGVPTRVWSEFCKLYEDESAEIAPYITTKIKNKNVYTVGAGRLADKLNSGFSQLPYDDYADIYAASIAFKEGYRVITASSKITQYKEMECDAVSLEDWADDLA